MYVKNNLALLDTITVRALLWAGVTTHVVMCFQFLRVLEGNPHAVC